MVLTVRFDSATARRATSVDFVACAAISLIETASSSIEPATVVTLTDAAPTEFSAARASDDAASAASLSPPDAPSRRPAASRNRSSACSTEARNCRIIAAIGLAAPLARRIGLALHAGQPFAFDHIVAEHHDRARHVADLVVGMGRGRARRGVAVGEPLHRRGQFLERQRDRAADAPAASQARSAPPPMPTQHDDVPGACPRRRQFRGGGAGFASRGGDDLVGLRQHARGVVVDERQ